MTTSILVSNDALTNLSQELQAIEKDTETQPFGYYKASQYFSDIQQAHINGSDVGDVKFIYKNSLAVVITSNPVAMTIRITDLSKRGENSNMNAYEYDDATIEYFVPYNTGDVVDYNWLEPDNRKAVLECIVAGLNVVYEIAQQNNHPPTALPIGVFLHQAFQFFTYKKGRD